jgi:uncharacterized protein
MQPEERDLIAGLFSRLNGFEAQPRDPEADRLIAQSISAQPGAPYLLVQTVLVQEQALKAAQARIAELEAKAAAPAPGFLASAPRIGPWGNASVPPTRPVEPAPAYAQPAYAQPAAGGFLRQALTTAAGVAGGALLFEGIRNMMGHNPGPFGSSVANAAPLLSPDSLMPPDHPNSSDLAQDDGAANDYDTTDDSGGSDSGGFDSGGSDDI